MRCDQQKKKKDKKKRLTETFFSSMYLVKYATNDLTNPGNSGDAAEPSICELNFNRFRAKGQNMEAASFLSASQLLNPDGSAYTGTLNHPNLMLYFR